MSDSEGDANHTTSRKGKRKATDEVDKPVEIITIDDDDADTSTSKSKMPAKADVLYFFSDAYTRPHPDDPLKTQAVRKCKLCVYVPAIDHFIMFFIESIFSKQKSLKQVLTDFATTLRRHLADKHEVQSLLERQKHKFANC